MFYYSTKSKNKIAHYKDCRFVGRIKEENLDEITSIKHVRKKGLKICSCCSPLVKAYKKERNDIFNFSFDNGLACQMYKGAFFVTTTYSQWQILPSNSDTFFDLHHKNTYNKEDKNSVSGYHFQNYSRQSILEHLEEIVCHDHYRLMNPLCVKSKKEPPKKGTKRWNKQQNKIKKRERSRKIHNVLNLIEGLSSSNYVTCLTV